jgi:MFS transporter, AAHS family, 4-hydroxybenzoate transporter
MPLNLQQIQAETNLKPMNSFQFLMIAICFILNFCDGIDVLIVSFSGTEIIKEFDLSKAQMGYIFSSGLVGMTLGCFLIAPSADKMGRRKILIFSLSLITIGMLLISMCNSYLLLLLLRFITGLGIGGILPAMAATASEFSNNKYRDFNVALVQAGWPTGAIITGFVCAYTIPHYGWRFAFLMAGCISLLMLLMVYFLMTDSLDFLLTKQPNNALLKINAVLKKMKVPVVAALPIKPAVSQKISPLTLFNTEFKDSTIKSWIAVFFGFLTLYTLMSWVPAIAKEMGLPPDKAIYAGVALNAGAAIGSASNGALGSKYGLRNTISLFMLSGFIVMLLYSNINWAITMLFILIFLIGIFVQGGFNGLYPALTRIYPSHIRTTGSGYAFGIGRLGAIIGPTLFGFLSDKGFTTALLFTLFSFPLLVSAICVYNLKSKNLITSNTINADTASAVKI